MRLRRQIRPWSVATPRRQRGLNPLHTLPEVGRFLISISESPPGYSHVLTLGGATRYCYRIAWDWVEPIDCERVFRPLRSVLDLEGIAIISKFEASLDEVMSGAHAFSLAPSTDEVIWYGENRLRRPIRVWDHLWILTPPPGSPPGSFYLHSYRTGVQSD